MAIREGRISSRGSTIVVVTRKINRTLSSIVNFNNETKIVAKKTFNKILIAVRKEIRKESPVFTGALRKSIKILQNKKKAKEFVGIIGPDGSAVNNLGESYAEFVVFGTFSNPANNFLKRGLDNAQPEIKKLVGQMGSDIRSVIRRVKS